MSAGAPAGRDLPGSVAVVGLGLIGSSLCRALRAGVPGIRLTGVDPDGEVTATARADGVCDAAGDGPELLGGNEVVVLCPPLDAIPGWLGRCVTQAPAALVTDCGSTKGWIAERARAIGGLRYLGGHPMAGRETGGYAAADAALFRGCTWVLTPEPGTDLDAFAPLTALLAAIGAHVRLMTPLEHDRAAAWASHLPQLASSALVAAATAAPEWPRARWLTAGAFRDAARLAGGDPSLHAAIATTNAAALGPALDTLIDELSTLRRSLHDGERLRAYFERARAARSGWLEARASAGQPVL